MRIAIVGYGKMGHAIEEMAKAAGHTIVATVNEGWSELPPCDVAIEFTQPEVAFDNISRLLTMGIPVVSGTTGWLDRWAEMLEIVQQHKGRLFYSSNYSMGIYLFSLLAKQVGKIMNQVEQDYDVRLSETHHIHKLDYPSGTALSLAAELMQEMAYKKNYVTHLAERSAPLPQVAKESLLITSIREGEVPGIHTIECESQEDIITLSHISKNRRGLAHGAVRAAEFLHTKGAGVYGMPDMMNIVL